MIVLKIILWVLLGILCVVALALAVPTRLFVRYTDEPFLQVRYLFLKINIPVTDSQKEAAESRKKRIKLPKKAQKSAKPESVAEKTRSEKPARKQSEQKKKPKKEKEKKPNAALEWVKEHYKKGGVDAIITAFKRIASLAGNILKPVFRHLRLKSLDIDILVASQDAADTAINYGRLCAGVYPALSVLLNVMPYDDYNVNIRPDFNKQELETDISAEISLIPWIAVAGALHALVRFLMFKVKGEL